MAQQRAALLEEREAAPSWSEKLWFLDPSCRNLEVTRDVTDLHWTIWTNREVLMGTAMCLKSQEPIRELPGQWLDVAAITQYYAKFTLSSWSSSSSFISNLISVEEEEEGQDKEGFDVVHWKLMWSSEMKRNDCQTMFAAADGSENMGSKSNITSSSYCWCP